jgi:hypothetical protein
MWAELNGRLGFLGLIGLARFPSFEFSSRSPIAREVYRCGS